MLTSRGISLVKILYLRDEPTRHNADIFRIQYSFLVIPFLIYEVVMVFKKLLNLFYQNLARFNFFSKRDVDISYSCLAIDWQVIRSTPGNKLINVYFDFNEPSRAILKDLISSFEPFSVRGGQIILTDGG